MYFLNLILISTQGIVAFHKLLYLKYNLFTRKILLYRLQTGYGTHTSSYPKGNGGSLPRNKAAGA
jgi:hypothetical protein